MVSLVTEPRSLEEQVAKMIKESTGITFSPDEIFIRQRDEIFYVKTGASGLVFACDLRTNGHLFDRVLNLSEAYKAKGYEVICFRDSESDRTGFIYIGGLSNGAS